MDNQILPELYSCTDETKSEDFVHHVMVNCRYGDNLRVSLRLTDKSDKQVTVSCDVDTSKTYRLNSERNRELLQHLYDELDNTMSDYRGSVLKLYQLDTTTSTILDREFHFTENQTTLFLQELASWLEND